jgi:hypothetical protein
MFNVATQPLPKKHRASEAGWMCGYGFCSLLGRVGQRHPM